MRRNKIKISGAVLRRRHAHHPVFQIGTISGNQGVYQQRRQRKIVDGMGFVSITEIGEVFPVWNVSFGNNDDGRVGMFN